MTRKNQLKATHTGEIFLGNVAIPCHVLEDGSRVISGRAMQNSLGFSKNASGSALTRFVETKLQKFLPEDVIEKLKNPLVFDRVGGGGSAPETYGNEGTILIDVCDALIQARKKKDFLTETQRQYADAAEMIIRSVAKVGIIALIDEATGYQEVRDKRALQALLDKYLQKELAAWAKRFPDEFYKEMFRLRGWNWSFLKRPSYVGKLTNDLVYERIAPGLLEELQKRNPKDETGKTKGRHHQLFTEEVGHPALAQHLYAVVGLMRACANWDEFYRLLQRSFGKKNDQLSLRLDED